MDKKTKILVIDDNKDVVTSMKIGLNSVDPSYDVLCATSGKEGLKMVESENPDIVLLDIMMPKMDGWSVCAKIKSSKKIPVIFVTAKVDQVSRMMGMKGADDYVEKPFDMRDLKEKIDKLTKG